MRKKKGKVKRKREKEKRGKEREIPPIFFSLGFLGLPKSGIDGARAILNLNANV